MEHFNQLIANNRQVHKNLQEHATSAVNKALTVRNILIGCDIIEFELSGKDRASYGSRLLSLNDESLQVKGLTDPELSRCRQFYQTYPQILVHCPKISVFAARKHFCDIYKTAR